MDNQFVNCPKCGTRNFVDDVVCGICQTKLKQTNIELNKQKENQPIQKTNYPILLIIAAGLCLLYYNVFKKDNSKDSKSYYAEETLINAPSYSILESKLNNKKYFNVAVQIRHKLNDNQLNTIAQRVKSEIKALSDIGVVFFFLPNMKVDNGAWAAVDFDPQMTVRVIGQSIEDEQKIISGLDKIKDYEGLWVDNFMKGDIIIRIRKDKKNGYVFEYISPDNPKPSNLASPLKKIIKAGKTVFIDIESDAGDYYVVNEIGDLECYDRQGYVSTFDRLK